MAPVSTYFTLTHWSPEPVVALNFMGSYSTAKPCSPPRPFLMFTEITIPSFFLENLKTSFYCQSAVFVSLFFPSAHPLTPQRFNWSGLTRFLIFLFLNFQIFLPAFSSNQCFFPFRLSDLLTLIFEQQPATDPPRKTAILMIHAPTRAFLKLRALSPRGSAQKLSASNPPFPPVFFLPTHKREQTDCNSTNVFDPQPFVKSPSFSKPSL